MKIKKIIINKNFYLQILGILFILVAVLINLKDRNMISILGDEFGYWTAGAYFAGYDWSGIASANGYFSFGYGILLAPLFMLQDGSLMYKVAVFYNAVFLCGNFLLGYHSVKKICHGFKDEIIILFSFVASVYPTFLVYSKTNMSEVLLSFLFWLIVFLLLSLQEKPTMIKAILIGFFLAYIYSVHLRTIAVVLSSVIYLFFMTKSKKIKIKHLMVVILVLGVLLIVSTIIKHQILNEIYHSNELSYSNDFTGQTHKLVYLLTPNGIVQLFKSIIGKIFYLGAATYFLFYCYISMSIKSIKKNLKKRRCSSVQNIHVFLLLNIIFTLGVSAIFTIYDSRIDTLLYGRYNEHILGPILILGMLEIIQNKKILGYLKICVIHFLLGIFIYHILLKSGVNQINSATITGIYQHMVEKNTDKLLHGYIILVTINSAISAMFMFAVVTLNIKRKNMNPYIISIFLLCLWLNSYKASYICRTIEMENSSTGCLYVEAENVIRQGIKDNKNIYYTYMEEQDNSIIYLWAGRIQFLIPESRVRVIKYKDLQNIDKKNSIILVKNDSYVKNQIEKEYSLISISDDITIFQMNLGEGE